jgi:hypothetical protein
LEFVDFQEILISGKQLKEVIHVSWDNKGIRKTCESDANDGAPLLPSLTLFFDYHSTESRSNAAFFVSGSEYSP